MTDSSALKGLNSTKNLQGKLGRWALLLGEMNFEVVHRQGRLHGNADGLSRHPGAEKPPDLSDTELAEVWSIIRTRANQDSCWQEENYTSEPGWDVTPEANVIKINGARKAIKSEATCDKCGTAGNLHKSYFCGACGLLRHERCNQSK